MLRTTELPGETMKWSMTAVPSSTSMVTQTSLYSSS